MPLSDRTSWASRLAEAFARQLQLRSLPIRLQEVRIVSDEELEVIYLDPLGEGLRGIRVGLASVRSGPERIRLSTIDEIAFDLVTMAIGEPRSENEYLAPDMEGIRWLPPDRWLV